MNTFRHSTKRARRGGPDALSPLSPASECPGCEGRGPSTGTRLPSCSGPEGAGESSELTDKGSPKPQEEVGPRKH